MYQKLSKLRCELKDMIRLSSSLEISQRDLIRLNAPSVITDNYSSRVEKCNQNVLKLKRDLAKLETETANYSEMFSLFGPIKN